MPDPRQLVTTGAVCVLAIAGYQALHGTSQAPAAAEPSAKPSGMLQPFMRFSGTGTITVRPDRGTISFSTHGVGSTLIEAQNEASTTMRNLIAKLRADGVAGSDMQTTAVSGYSRGRLGGFAAEQSLTVTVRDLHKTGRLLADGAAVGAHGVSGVDFSIAEKRAAYNRALRVAVGDARSKALAAATAAGLHVSGVVSVNETDNPTPVYYGDTLQAAGSAAYPAVAVPVKRGSQQVTADVTVVFSYSS